MFWIFGREAYGISAPQPGIEPAPPALEGEVLTIGPPGKSQEDIFCYCIGFGGSRSISGFFWFFHILQILFN